MKKNAKIYIAGHRGLVGSAILRKLETDGYTNIVTRTHAELDLTSQAEVKEFFYKQRLEYVFLAAAKVGGIIANSTYPAEFIYHNLMIQTNIIHSAYLYGVNKLLFLGSSCIYPKCAPQPMKEEYLLTGGLEPTNEPYSVAKIAGIKLCQSYNRQYGTNFISVMPTNLYGPNDNFDLETSHVLPALIRKFHEGKICMSNSLTANNLELETNASELSQPLNLSTSQPPNSVTIWGTGSPRREFLYVDDLADACLFLMENYNSSEIINIGTGEDITIKKLSEMIKFIVGFKGEIVFDTTKPDGVPRKLLDVSKIKSLGWEPEFSLEDGITRTYEWYCHSL